MLLVLSISFSTAFADALPPTFTYEKNLKGSIWCKLSNNSYIPINVITGSSPSFKSKDWSYEIKKLKTPITKAISTIKKNIKKSTDKVQKRVLQNQLFSLNKKIASIDLKHAWKFAICNQATDRIIKKRNDAPAPTNTPIQNPAITSTPTFVPILYPPSETPTSTPLPTPRAEINEAKNIEIKQHEQKEFILKNFTSLRAEILSLNNLIFPSQTNTNPITISCEISKSELKCNLNNGSFVGQVSKQIRFKEFFSDYSEDYRISSLDLSINAQGDLSSFSNLEVPTADQLIAQVRNDQGRGIRPWDKTVSGFFEYVRQGDPTAIIYKERLLNSLTRINGGSSILQPIPAINDLDTSKFSLMDQCRFLETSLLPNSMTWHVLNADGTPAKNGSNAYILRSYTASEMKDLIRSYMVKMLKRYSEFSTWYDGNAEIGRSMLASQYATAYSCIRDEISESDRALFEQTLRDKYITPTLNLYKNPSWPLNSEGKVDSGNQGIELAGVFAIANAILMKESPQESAKNIIIALTSLDRFLNVLYRGGSLEEGPNYHHRSFDYLIRLDEALWNTFGTNFGLITPNSAIARESSLWLYNSYGPGGYQFSFNDANSNTDMINTSKQTPWGYGIGLYLADLFNDQKQAVTEIGKLQADWPGDIHFLYYKPYNAQSIFDSTPKEFTSTGYPLFAARSAHSAEALYIGAVGMMHGWIHNQKSPGKYVIHWKGVPFVESLGQEKANINYGFDGADYWTQTARRYDIYRSGTLGSNSLTLSNPTNNAFILSGGRAAGYESESDPNIEFSNSKASSTKSSSVLDMTKAYSDFNSVNYATSSQNGWPLPAGRFVQKALRGYALEKPLGSLPWSYVCDETQYTSSATTNIGFNTPAAVSPIGGNKYRLSYTQPINSTGGTRAVSITLHLQSTTALNVNISSLNDLPSNPSRYPSWWPWSLPGFQCDVDSTQDGCFKPTHLPNMSRVNVTTTGSAARVCMIFVPDPETGPSFTPPTIPAVSTW